MASMTLCGNLRRMALVRSGFLERFMIPPSASFHMTSTAACFTRPGHLRRSPVVVMLNSGSIQHPVRGFSSHYDKWTELTYEDLVALLESGDIQLFDVREPKEIEDTGAIPGSINIPLGEIKKALQMDDVRFTEHYRASKPQPHDTNLVFYGLGPIKSSAALEISHKIGFKKARHYAAGYEEWSTKHSKNH